MSKLKIVLFILSFLFVCNKSLADEKLTWSIVHLAELADTVVEAKFLQMDDKYITFKIKSLESEVYIDTIVMKFPSSYYNSPDPIKNSESLLIFTNLFSNDGTKLDTMNMGSVRIFTGKSILTAYQRDNPGPMYFGGGQQDTLTWSAFKQRVMKVNRRIKKIYGYQKIKERQLQNKLLLDFIKENQDSFNQDCNYNEDCGWGFLEEKVFKWIAENGIGKDTWEAAQLYINIEKNSRWRRNTPILYETGLSFNTNEEKVFLVSKAASESEPEIERLQALYFLYTAKPSQKDIKEHILPLLSDSIYRDLALKVIRQKREDEKSIAMEILPTIKTKFKNAPIGEYKNDLADYLARNSTMADWKQISECDENLLFYIYSARIDTSSKKLSFYFNEGHRTARYEVWTELQPYPTIIIINKESSKEVYRMKLEDEKLNSWARNIRIDIANLDKGSYEFYLIGTAGKEAQYKWKSIEGEFVIE